MIMSPEVLKQLMYYMLMDDLQRELELSEDRERIVWLSEGVKKLRKMIDLGNQSSFS